MDAHYQYLGTTSTSSNVNSSGGCNTADGHNVVEFGSLPSGYLALTCWWTNGSSTIEMGMRLNKGSFLWTANVGSTCSNKFAVEAAATHEFGHAYGMGHVDPVTDANETMSPVIAACQTSQSTLAKGDVLGLESKY